MASEPASPREPASAQPDSATLRLLFALGGESRLARLVQRDVAGAELARALDLLEAQTPDLDLFCRRVLAVRRPTLRQLGEELGVSAERVRQREKRAREAIADQLQIEDSPLRRAVTELRACFGSLARLRDLEGVMADARAEASGSGIDRQALLLHLTGHEACGEWVQSVGLDRRTATLLESLTRGGPVELERCCRELERLGVREELRRAWIASRPGFLVLGDQLARESRVTDVAIAVLRGASEPLDLHELFTRTRSTVSYETFRSHVQRDERFIRRGVRRYGLSEWGGDPYTTLAEEMTAEIDRNGGAISLEELARGMAKRFDVAEGSVLHRARAPQFEVDAAGTISRRVAPLVEPPVSPHPRPPTFPTRSSRSAPASAGDTNVDSPPGSTQVSNSKEECALDESTLIQGAQAHRPMSRNHDPGRGSPAEASAHARKGKA